MSRTPPWKAEMIEASDAIEAQAQRYAEMSDPEMTDDYIAADMSWTCEKCGEMNGHRPGCIDEDSYTSELDR